MDFPKCKSSRKVKDGKNKWKVTLSTNWFKLLLELKQTLNNASLVKNYPRYRTEFVRF
jgi:hypothetical protein